MMHAYHFKAYAKRADADYVPSLIGSPTGGSSAEPVYYERFDLTDRTIIAMSITQYVVEGSNDPILSIRLPSGKTCYIPKGELENIAAEHQDDDTVEMMNALFKRRRF